MALCVLRSKKKKKGYGGAVCRISAHKSESLKFSNEVTSDPDSVLCLAVGYVCDEKALLILSGSVQRCSTDAVLVATSKKYLVLFVVLFFF